MARATRTMQAEELLEVAVEAATAGADVLRRLFRAGRLDVSFKSRHDLVTSADHEAEGAILEVIRHRCPSHAILSEEAGVSAGDGRYRWLVDPLDGTSNFAQGHPYHCVSVACYAEDEPVIGVVVDPQGDNVFTAARGGGARWNGEPMRVSPQEGLDGSFVATGYPFRRREALELYLRVFRDVLLSSRACRRCGAAALDLAYTAAGVYDGFFELRLSPWDIAAGVVLVREAGGVVSDLDGGGAFLDSGNVLAGGPGVWRALLDTVARHADEAALRDLEPVAG